MKSITATHRTPSICEELGIVRGKLFPPRSRDGKAKYYQCLPVRFNGFPVVVRHVRSQRSEYLLRWVGAQLQATVLERRLFGVRRTTFAVPLARQAVRDLAAFAAA